MKKIALVVALLLTTLPFSASAMDPCSSGTQGATEYNICTLQLQIMKLQSQLTQLLQKNDQTLSPGHDGPACLNLKNNLVIGSTDGLNNGEVSKLQKFLLENNYGDPDGDSGYLLQHVTGYYGVKTAASVVNWQKAHGMDFVTTKSGVGPMTRGKMKCATTQATVEKISWIIESANPEITDENDYRKYEQKVSIDVTRSDKTTQRYVAGKMYGCGVWKDAPLRDNTRTILGAVTCYYAASGGGFMAFTEDGRLYVEKTVDDASGRTAGSRTIVLSL